MLCIAKFQLFHFIWSSRPYLHSYLLKFNNKILGLNPYPHKDIYFLKNPTSLKMTLQIILTSLIHNLSDADEVVVMEK